MQVLFCLHGYIQIFHLLFYQLGLGNQRKLHMSSPFWYQPKLSGDDSVNVIWNSEELVVSLLTLGKSWIGNHASVVLRCDNRYRGNTIVQVYLLLLLNNWRYGNGPYRSRGFLLALRRFFHECYFEFLLIFFLVWI